MDLGGPCTVGDCFYNGSMENQTSAASLDDYPADWVEQVRLEDGLEVQIRPIRPEDAKGLKEGFKRLSPQSIYLRFLRPVKQLAEDEAQSLATLDYRTKMAFVACLVEEGKDFIIGVARYAALDPGTPEVVECAVIVGDEFQGRGLGSILLDRLIRYGRAQGVTTIQATTHLTNQPIMHFIEQSGFSVKKTMLEPGVWEFRMWI